MRRPEGRRRQTADDRGSAAVWHDASPYLPGVVEERAHIGRARWTADRVRDPAEQAAPKGDPVSKALAAGVTDPVFPVGRDERMVGQSSFRDGGDDLAQRGVGGRCRLADQALEMVIAPPGRRTTTPWCAPAVPASGHALMVRHRRATDGAGPPMQADQRWRSSGRRPPFPPDPSGRDPHGPARRSPGSAVIGR